MKASTSVQCERYSSYTSCGQALILEVFGEVGKVVKMTIGNRFFVSVKCYPSQCGYNNQQLHDVFDFFNNYACLLNWEELKKGWACYQKATRQRSDTVKDAFWNYFEDKKTVRLDRKGSCFKWVKVTP